MKALVLGLMAAFVLGGPLALSGCSKRKRKMTYTSCKRICRKTNDREHRRCKKRLKGLPKLKCKTKATAAYERCKDRCRTRYK